MRRSLPHEYPFNLLATLCSGWGGKLVRVSTGHFQRMHEEWAENGHEGKPIWPCPFNEMVCLDWDHKIVYYMRSRHNSKGDLVRCDWPAVVHEMGHVFATELPPDKCSEIEWFVWEYMIARDIDDARDWFKSNRYYGIGNGVIQDFGDLDPQGQFAYLTGLIPGAIASGRLDVQLRPRALR